jgi:asparagine synthase (glutamine-hydrolysing)
MGTLGHARLSILDVAGSHQPMSDDLRWIVFNGEVYNFLTLRQTLPAPWKTHGDTEVVLKLLNQKGTRAINELDGMFAFVTFDDGILLARDPLGIKPLYFIQDHSMIYFASEIKALLDFPGEIIEFPAGHTWDGAGAWEQFFSPFDIHLDESLQAADEELYERTRSTLRRAVQKRLIADPDIPVGVSLSGGLDSSLIAALAREGRDELNTFVVGMLGSEDIARSEEVARALGTRHHVYRYDFAEMLQVLPEVIYHLESFDAALVRSAIPNYFLARLASQHVKVMLTGEGADELFGGYEYLRNVTNPEYFHGELCLTMDALHNTNLQRTDRMTMAHGIEGRVPFLDMEMVRLALSIPPALKFHSEAVPEKLLLRKAFEGYIPNSALYRPKQKFSQGAGSMNLLAEYADSKITDAMFSAAQVEYASASLRSKEELLYFRIFREQFGERLDPETIGRTRSVATGELN